MDEIGFYKPEAKSKAIEALEKAKKLEQDKIEKGYRYIKEGRATIKLKRYEQI